LYSGASSEIQGYFLICSFLAIERNKWMKKYPWVSEADSGAEVMQNWTIVLFMSKSGLLPFSRKPNNFAQDKC